MDKKRTNQQNSALHVLYKNMSDELNNAGLDQRKVLKPGIDIPWTPEAIKEQIWRPIQKAMFMKESTTELTTTEIDKIFDVINRQLSIEFGFSIEFPSIETIIMNERIKNGN